MVYTGQPSKGCATCRKRRIKCDEKLPQCGACIRVKQECPGYKNHFDLAWRDQTTVAKQGVERGKAKRKAAREAAEASSSKVKTKVREKVSPPEEVSTSSNSSGSPPSVFTPPSQDLQHSPQSSNSWTPPPPENDYASLVPIQSDPYLTILRPIPEEQALCFFFNIYVFPIRDPLARRGFLEYLAPFYMNADAKSPVKMSTMAVATCMMSTRMGQPSDSPLSRSFYLRAVSRIKEIVSKQKDCAGDELIFAVMLLHFYEATVGQLMKRSATKNPTPHLDGALALIRHRGPHNFTDPVSKSILLYVRSLVVSQIDDAFRSATAVPYDVQTWLNYVPESEQLPGFRLDTITLDLANLQAAAFAIIRSPKSDDKTSQLLEINKRAILIGKRLQTWSESLPDSWSPVRVHRENGISPTLQLYQDYCDVYKSLYISSVWNKLRLAQIEVRYTLLASLTQLQPTPSNRTGQKVCQDCIQQLADDMCASVPFFLGDRWKPGRPGDPNVNYPRAPGRPSIIDHYHSGPAMGGWSLIIPLGTLNKMNIHLREGQRAWIGGQIARTMRIYNIHSMPKPPAKKST